MKKIFLYIVIIITYSSFFYTCKKLDTTTDVQKCPHATDGLIVKKWASVFTQVDEYGTNGAVQSTLYSHPLGFLQFNSNSSYSAISDGLSVKGKWLIDANCDLALDAGGSLGVTFNIIKLTSDSLTISQKVGSTLVTQHFGIYSCDYQPYIVRKWANAYTRIDTYASDGLTLANTTTIKPIGFFELNSDATYRVLSDNVPLNGLWKANTDYCQITLDSTTSLQRTFDIIKANNDSLVIRRKAGNIIYTQHYNSVICPSLDQLEQTWNNISIKTDYFSNGGISNTDYSYPSGIFKLNADATYNVNSDGVPLDGVWQLLDQTHGCPLILDSGTSLQRAFDVLQLTTDSLTIWRLDNNLHIGYTQKYKK